jgi:hypothetical protein
MNPVLSWLPFHRAKMIELSVLLQPLRLEAGEVVEPGLR